MTFMITDSVGTWTDLFPSCSKISSKRQVGCHQSFNSEREGKKKS